LPDSEELVTFSQAATMLGVSRNKIARLVKAGKLTLAGTEPLDARIKYLRRAEVEALAAQSPRYTKAPAA
jgi:hypothetical protein